MKVVAVPNLFALGVNPLAALGDHVQLHGNGVGAALPPQAILEESA